MMKTKAYSKMLLLAALLALPAGVKAQVQAAGYYTLTNGHYYWFDGTESDPDDSKYLTAWDSTGWKAIYKLGTHEHQSVTEIVEQGTMYLALDTGNYANPHPDAPAITAISTSNGFNPLCVWYRTGKTGHYYQEWPCSDGKVYRYYLYATHNDGLSVFRQEVGTQLQQTISWYNWDHGMAIEEEVWRNGALKTSDFWVIYDDLDETNGGQAAAPAWRLSTVHCYQRPEEMMVRNYRADGMGGNTWDYADPSNPSAGITYYDNVHIGAWNYPSGTAATFIPVEKIDHPKAIQAGHGLVRMEYIVTDGDTPQNLEGLTLTYERDESIVVSPVMNATVQMVTTPAYTEYVEETYRRGINLSDDLRDVEGFGRGGVPTVRRWYFYPDAANAPATRHDDIPSDVTETATVTRTEYTLDSRSTRYLSITPTGSNSCKVTLFDRPVEETNAYLTCTVTYDNGTTESMVDTLHVTFRDKAVTAYAKSAPVVRGSVFGGGRMANVQGNTSVTVHNTDSIYALYGGNDIAGWVQGNNGATLQIGTRHTTQDHPVHIGWVYGGGCGYYTYEGINPANIGGSNKDPYLLAGGKTNLGYQAYFFNGHVYPWNSLPADYETYATEAVDHEDHTLYANAAWDTRTRVVEHEFSYQPYWRCSGGGGDPSTVDNTEDGNGGDCMTDKSYLGTIPYVKTAHINIGVPEVSGHLFAEPDVTAMASMSASEKAAYLQSLNTHQHNDYILIDSLFGGAENAFIGVTSTSGDYASAITLDINGGTMLAVFGGNNYGGSVAKTSTVTLNVHCTKLADPAHEEALYNSYYHGMGRDFGIRYLFGGGNMVESSHAEVQFLGGMVDTAFIGGNLASVQNPIGIVNCQRSSSVPPLLDIYGNNGHFIYTNPTMRDTTNNGRGDQNNNFVPDQGVYNVHFLFGGNNKAPMENVSFIQLISGGVGSVYGGGNMGDMTNNRDISVAKNNYIDLNFLLATMLGAYQNSTLITAPRRVGAVIAAMEDSKIIADYLYGGCRSANVLNSCGLYLAGGNYSDVFGGNDVSGDVGSEVDGATYVVVTGNAVVQGSVYGGSDGYYHCDDGTGHYDDQKMVNTMFNENVDYDPYNDFTGSLFPSQNHTNVFVDGGLIKGNLVAGGMMSDVGFSGDRTPMIKNNTTGIEHPLSVGSKKGTVRLEITGNAEIRGNVFGGGANASIYGLSQVYVHESPTILGGLFAGNDCIGKVQSFLPYQSIVDYSGCVSHDDSLAAEHANQAAQASSNGDPLNVLQDDGTYNPRYHSYLLIEGTPIINSVYGSGNGAWDYDGTRPQFKPTFVCPDKLDAGSRPNQESTFIDIHTSGGYIDTVFGGGAGCSVNGSVVVMLNNTDKDNPAYPATLPAGFKGGNANGKNFVGTIFGGNNFDDMYTVPEIRLVQGNVKNVYGGANKGNMKFKTNFEDICGNPVKDVSTHILSESANVTITDSLFGGCRMSDIEGMAYVDIRKTSDEGIKYLYGGNDVSGNVLGSTRIDVSSGTVYRMWGGSNGRYDFVPVGYEEYNVYNFGTYDAAHPTVGLITTAGRPNVDTTFLNLWGGNIMSSVFAGGSMADCKETYLTVNDKIGCSSNGISTGHLTVNGAIYGGGEGRWDDLNARDFEGNRWGNINGSTHVNLYHADDVSTATAYGGGGGGDVYNTFIKTYETWDSPFLALYGGCWGSDVHGTTHLEFDGNELVHNLYGGNDFTGNVYRSEIVVNNGHFYNIYGGGNGDYPDSYYTSQHDQVLQPEFAYQHARPNAYSGDTVIGGVTVSRNLTRPNTEYITLTFNDGEVYNNLYGGGKMGTTMRNQRDASGNYLTDKLGRYLPDTTLDLAHAYSDPLDYSYVITNIHGGNFQNNVFGGASGNSKYNTRMDPLVYGVKVLNMDDGEVHMNLYGGSERVNDGYPAECISNTSTSKRPSTIMNLTGGLVEGNLYGAGYLGTTYGSVYVNVGTTAIDSCVAYSAIYPNNSEDSAYSIFKPGLTGSLSPALGRSNMLLNHSIYSGANWGAATGQANFNNPGFFGGESIINIDGLNYNTSHDPLNTLPQMNIAKSIFGSGTSVKGGDVRSHINLRNYGVLENCHPTRELESVQRTDQFVSHNTSVHYLGATDATSAYISAPYSINLVTTMAFRGFNVAEYDAMIDRVWELKFYEEALDASNNLVLVPIQTLREVPTSDNACGNTATICANLEVVSPDDIDKKHTLLILNNGIDFDVKDIISGQMTSGRVTGFGYVTTPVGYSSSIIGGATAYLSGTNTLSYFDQGRTWDDGLSGFASPCDTSNKYTADRGITNWEDLTASTHDDAEFPYTNFLDESAGSLNYREWKFGKGIRLRETAILAHADPTKLEQDVSTMIDSKDLALAKATITLPATATGHYYTLDPSGINIKGSTSAVNLVDSTWSTSASFADLAATYPTDVSSQGDWVTASVSGTSILSGPKNIIDFPDNTFGLVLIPNENFKKDGTGQFVMPGSYTPDKSRLVLSGNAYFNASDFYCSPIVTEGDRVMPTMDFLMTYNPNFNTTFLGTVDFILNEYDENGVLVGPVKVKAYISTILEEFRNIETNVLAMFNNGVENHFTRRVILPITIDENRELFIKSVEWYPTLGNGTQDLPSEKFYLTENESTITGATPHTVNNLFGMKIVPNDAVTGDLNENLGWTSIDNDTINVFTLACASGTASQKQQNQSLITTDHTNGTRIGILDGRGTAALNVQLAFDGSRVYPEIEDNGYVGKVVLGLRWVKGENSGDFNLIINVKTRENGDTIYVATNNSVSRNGFIVQPYYANDDYLLLSGSDDPNDKLSAANMIGKSPNCYVQSFQHALSSSVYQEGDVIAIIDTVKISNQSIHIQGADGPPIQVIRYAGHHHELPSDTGGVYRGPMIIVDGPTSYFTAQNIDFHGSAGALVKHVLRDGSGNPIFDGSGNHQFTSEKGVPDTNEVFAPILMAKNEGSIELLEGTKVRHNWNEYGSAAGQLTTEGLPVKPSMMGAISLTTGGSLTLSGDITIRDNLSHTMPVDLTGNALFDELHPGNGAIYIDGGSLILSPSNKRTAIDITHNYLMNPAIHTDPTSVNWWTLAYIDGNPSRYTLDTTKVYNIWQRANVFLTRTQPTTLPAAEEARIAALPAAEQAEARQYYLDMHDSQTDNIQVIGTPGTKSRISVSKWFPGEEIRDTIRFAVYPGNDPTIMENVSLNHNFQSDDDYLVFYSPEVNNKTAFLLRCATFKHQWIASDHLYVDPLYDGYNLTVDAHDVLRLGARNNVCPIGGDSIIYHVQGGFMPYTYTWSNRDNGTTISSKATPYSNAQVQNDLNNNTLSNSARSAKYIASMSDTLLLPHEEMTPFTDRKWSHLQVSVVDATGICSLNKDIDLRIKMEHVSPNSITYLPFADLADTASYTDNNSPWQTAVSDGWTDTSRTKVAVASRNYRGVRITPQVWADRSYGTIDAVVAGDNNDYVYQFINDSETHELSNLMFCPGDIIYLHTEPKTPDAHFVMWDFDPFYQQLAVYSVPVYDATVTAYYSPTDYWHEVVNTPIIGGAAESNSYIYGSRPSAASYTLENEGTTTTEAGYVTTYHGDVHIYNENGLAWFISVVNGLNGTQARSFYYNNVYLHQKSGGYDMKKHLWTPVGTLQHRFRGGFFGVESGETSTTRASEPVIISNIIVDEPDLQNAGFFAFLDSSVVDNIQLQGELIRGSQYVGGLAAQSEHSKIVNCKVLNSDEPTALVPNPALTILTTHHTSGGLIGHSLSDSIDACVVAAKYVGDAVYNGGVIGYGTSSKIYNSATRNINRMSAIYSGGVAGYLGGEGAYSAKGHRKSANDSRSIVMNNYIQYVDEANNQRVGGLVGHAKNTILENNYIYGLLGGESTEGGVAAILDSGAVANHNYYESTATKRSVGQYRANASSSHTSNFSGSGNQVILSTRDYGVNNLTRVLNIWVRAHGSGFKTWRSDLYDDNNGYPLFGVPDMIPVVDSMLVTGCDSVEWDGQVYLFDDEVISHFVDSVMMVDSTFTLRIQVNHATRQQVSDSVSLGNDYHGYGFTLTAVEVQMLQMSALLRGSATIVLSDTLESATGCDSILTLLLTVNQQQAIVEPVVTPQISVYPNPTISRVNVETTKAMSHVELYDNNGRLLQDYNTNNSKDISIDVSQYPTGAYYLRVHTADNVTIQKLIKK